MDWVLGLRNHVSTGLPVEIDRPQLAYGLFRVFVRTENRVSNPEGTREVRVIGPLKEALIMPLALARLVPRSIEMHTARKRCIVHTREPTSISTMRG